MSDEDLLEYVTSCFNESDKVWTNDLKPTCDDSWNLYRIWRDYSKKKDWQAKHVNPRAFASVEIATALIKKSLTGSENLFRVDGQDPNDKKVAPLVREAVIYHLKRAKFLQKFVESLKIAMIIGLGCLKVYWKRWEEDIASYKIEYKEEPIKLWGIELPFMRKIPQRVETIKTIQKSELIIESKDPYCLRIDPFAKFTEKPKYIIEVEEIDFSEIKKLADEGYYENIDKLEDTMRFNGKPPETSEDYEVPESGREMIASPAQTEIPSSQKSEFRKPVVLWHFWGDVETEKEINPNKKVQVYENWNVVVANGKTIIRNVKNPNFHGKAPYIFIPCIIIPFRFMPMGLIEPISSSLAYQDDLYNFILDAMKFDMGSMFGVDLDAIEDPINDLIIEPFHFIKMRTSGQNIDQAIKGLTGQIKNYGAAMNMIASLDRIVQLASGVVDPLMGMVTKGEQTATEFRGVMSQSTVKFESIAKDIEEFSIVTLLELVYQLIFQNLDPGMWIEITGEDGTAIQEYITVEKIEGNFDFFASGISGYLYQLEYISKIVTIFSTMVQAAPLLQLTPEEARKVFKKIIEAHGLKDVASDISDVPSQLAQVLQMIQVGIQRAMSGDPSALPQLSQIIQQFMGQQGNVKGGEAPTQPPNPNMGPENTMQMLNKGGLG